MSFSSSQRLLTDNSPRLRKALRYTIYGKSGVFDADRFIDVLEAFETFAAAAKSGGGGELQGNMASYGLVPAGNIQWPSPTLQNRRVQTRTALLFIFSEQGEFFREFILDEVRLAASVCCEY